MLTIIQGKSISWGSDTAHIVWILKRTVICLKRIVLRIILSQDNQLMHKYRHDVLRSCHAYSQVAITCFNSMEYDESNHRGSTLTVPGAFARIEVSPDRPRYCSARHVPQSCRSTQSRTLLLIIDYLQSSKIQILSEKAFVSWDLRDHGLLKGL
jgi:hypothetical protein